MQAFVKVTVWENVWSTTGKKELKTYYAVKMKPQDGGIALKANGHGYWFPLEDVVSIEPAII